MSERRKGKESEREGEWEREGGAERRYEEEYRGLREGEIGGGRGRERQKEGGSIDIYCVDRVIQCYGVEPCTITHLISVWQRYIPPICFLSLSSYACRGRGRMKEGNGGSRRRSEERRGEVE